MSLAPDNLAVQKNAILLFFASGDREILQKGKALLDELMASNPDDVELRLYKSRSLLTKGTNPAVKQAVDILQKITEEQPDITEAWTLLAQIALGQGQSTKALDFALRGLIYQPNDKKLLLLRAKAEAAKSPILAIPTLKILQERYANDADIAIYLANT
ncbi:MAG: hypothetical protein MUO68_01170, partial [Desulfobacteraceae bacterium]|nr:hypothetical protein [Desulfobacteraceae bacterium]